MTSNADYVVLEATSPPKLIELADTRSDRARK